VGIGKLTCHVFHVTDLEVGQRFWAEVTGIQPIPTVFPGRSAYLGQADPWRHEVILWKVDEPKGTETNRSHVDIWVHDVDVAIEQIVDIGGSLKRPPTIYPRPHSYPGEPSRIDWAVMQDPFGNEFCLVSVLSPEEARAVAEAGRAGPGDDDHWREAAGRARRNWWTNHADNDNHDEEHNHGHAH
jgi:predicted enzyme related to lactoylglutathione lyase